MGTLSIKLKAEPLRSLDYSSIVAFTYMGVGSSFAHPLRILNVINSTDALLFFSLNGIDDNFVLPPDGFILLDVSANQTFNQGWFIAEGQRIYVRADVASPTTGSVYVSCFYGGE